MRQGPRWILLLPLLIAGALFPSPTSARSAAEPNRVIVQSADVASAASAVRQVGGEVTHELAIIDAVGAMTDNYTPGEGSDDILASFSAADPTYEAYLWTDGYLWTDAYLWTDGYLWTNGLTEPASVNLWVEQE